MEELTDKKKAIFESTLALIGEYGFHGAPMSMVAKNANVAAGTIYHYFKSKDDLLEELFTYCKKILDEYITENSCENFPYKEQFFNGWLIMYHFYTSNPHILNFFEQYVNSPYNKERKPHYHQGKIFLFLKEGIRNNHLKEAKAETFLALFIGSAIASAKLNVYGSFSFEKDDLNQIIEMLWIGVVKSP